MSFSDSFDIQNSVQELSNTTTFRKENYSFIWRIAQFGECMDRKFEFLSPTYCPTSEQETQWKMMMFQTDIYPEGKHVGLRIIKTNDDDKYYSVMYTVSIIDGNGKVFKMVTREKVFRHCLDFDECSVISNIKLKENNLLSNGYLTINCKMNILIPESPEENFSSSTACQVNTTPTRSGIFGCKTTTTLGNGKSLEGSFRTSKGNSTKDSSHSTLQSLEFLSNDFKTLYLNKEDCDIIIRASDGELQAHKAVLIARSDYFRIACINQKGTFRNPEIYISEIKSIIMEFVLYYLYTGELRQLTFEMAIDILAACEKLRLSQLEKIIQNYLKYEIKVNNVIDLFKISRSLKMDSLKNSALKFMSLNYEEIEKTGKWKEMMRSEPRAAGEVLLTVASFKKNFNYNK